jgi:hypothetical protein
MAFVASGAYVSVWPGRWWTLFEEHKPTQQNKNGDECKPEHDVSHRHILLNAKL